jgi:hypothetical protein
MTRVRFLAVAVCAVALASATWAQPTPWIIEIPLDQQINLGLPGTADSPNGDAIYVPTWNHEDSIEFRSDEAEGYCRLWIGTDPNDPNAQPGWWYGPYIDFTLAGYDELIMSGHNALLEYDCRYQQGDNNEDPFADAPIAARLYTYDVPGDAYQGHISYDYPYQTGAGNLCDPKPLGYPEWWHVVVDLDDLNADFWCDGTPDVYTGGAWDLGRIARMRFFGTDWFGAYYGPCDDWIDVKNFKLTLYPPPCVGDLNDDGTTDLSDLGILLAAYNCDVTPLVLFDAGGFEAYSDGYLPGQFDWYSVTGDWEPNDPYTFEDPVIMDDPTGGGMGKVVYIDAPDGSSWAGYTGAGHDIALDPNEGYVHIEWDQYRPDTGDNFFYEDQDGGWWAIQWDVDGCSAYDYGQGAVWLTPGVWQHIHYILDYTNGIAMVEVDGQNGGGVAFLDDMFDGFYFYLVGTDIEGDGPIYLDNFSISYQTVLECPGDYNDDGHTDLSDLGFLLADYNCVPEWP